MSDTSETVFTYASPRLRFGPGAADEIWHDLTDLGARRALVMTDPGVLAAGAPDRVADQLRILAAKIEGAKPGKAKRKPARGKAVPKAAPKASKKKPGARTKAKGTASRRRATGGR